VVRDYTAAATLTQATLAVRIAPDTPATLSGDRPLLLRLLSNLVINALQHGSARTEITLMAGRHDQQVRLSVANRGPVLSEEARRSLFQPFTRLAGASAHVAPGSGLTLARLPRRPTAEPWTWNRPGSRPAMARPSIFTCPCTTE
jgi:two-component system sensor histidine kinase KdpD